MPGRGLLAGRDTGALVASARLDDDEVAALVRSALQDATAQVRRWETEPVDYAFGSPTTGGLLRIRGVASTADGEAPWSVFVKVVQSYRHWPLLDRLPPPVREQALTSSTWRYEPDLYAHGLGGALPDGLRLPRVHRIRDLGDERIAVMLEDVPARTGPWGAQRFSRAAQLLGRLAARLARCDALPTSALRDPAGVARLHYTSRALPAALPALEAESTWRHPLLAAGSDPGLRGDLLELARRVPRVLDALDRLPQAVGHGDASPQNLLVPEDEPDTFVAVDWTLGGIAAVGDDLGQLLVGLAHAGQLTTAELPALRDAIAPAYAAGLAAEALPVDESAVRYAMDGGLVARSAFTALPLERLAEPVTDELADLVTARLRLTRYLVDLGLALPEQGPAADIAHPDVRTRGGPHADP